MANSFDDEFDEAPQSTFDDEFEAAASSSAAPIEERPSFLQRMGQSASEMVSPALETAEDFSVGAAQGLSMGTMDELGGMIGAGIETGLGKLGIGPAAVDAQLKEQGFQVPEESFLQKYRGYQQASEKAQEESEARSPVANIAGQLVGGMTGGSILGSTLGVGTGAKNIKSITDIAKDSGKSKAALELLARGGKSYAQSLPLMIPELAATSKEQLIGENANPMGVAADVAGGMAFGLPAMLGVQAVSDIAIPSVSKKIESVGNKISGAFTDESQPRLRQIAKAYKEYGQELGIHPRSHAQDIKAGPEAFALRDEKAVNSVLGQLGEADGKLGQEVGNSLKTATESGRLVNISPDIEAAGARIAELAETIPELGTSRRSAAAYDKILNRQQQLNPLELKTLIDDIDASIGVFKAATNKTPQDASTLSELMRFRSSISQSLKKEVPEYRFAAERFENFRNVLEQVVSRDRPVEVTNKFYGKLNDAENKLYGSIDDMIKNVQRDDAASQPSRTSFVKFMEALGDFQKKEVSRAAENPNIQKVIPDAEQVRKLVLSASDDSVLRSSSRATTQGRSLVPDIKEWVIGKAPTSIAYHAGKLSKSLAPQITSGVDVSRKIFKAPEQYLKNLASQLETTPGLSSMGKALTEAIASGNSPKKNAAIFTIMQNPNAKLFINADDLKDEEE
jgi:hypothetical protein